MSGDSRDIRVTDECVFELPVGPPRTDRTFDVCVLRFDDDARPVKQKRDQLEQVKERIELARSGRGRAKDQDQNGAALVVVFIHGWHHNHEWHDGHFSEFRDLLTRLARREVERRDEHTRRVVGIYIGWNGDRPGSRLWRLPGFNHLTFWDRFRVACKLGESDAMERAFNTIVRAVKKPTEESRGRESPLVVVGHSMGALITQRCVQRLLSSEMAHARGLAADVQPMPPDAETIHAETRSKYRTFPFPDLVLTLNSAANASIAKDIREMLLKVEMRREAKGGQVRYVAPIMISATARADWITRCVWRLANRFEKTDGHSDELRTHDLRECGPAHCAPAPTERSFGQSWHCLRRPEPSSHEAPSFGIDLPAKPWLDSARDNLKRQHVRYYLNPRLKVSMGAPSSFWVFSLPWSLSKGHNDIFNYRSSLLVLALMQISGAAVSLAENWTDVFEPETADPPTGRGCLDRTAG